jgi:hypothetical protein
MIEYEKCEEILASTSIEPIYDTRQCINVADIIVGHSNISEIVHRPLGVAVRTSGLSYEVDTRSLQ